MFTRQTRNEDLLLDLSVFPHCGNSRTGLKFSPQHNNT